MTAQSNNPPQSDLESKVCKLCHENLPIENFGLDKWNQDGHRAACISCTETYVSERTKSVLDTEQEQECEKCHRTLKLRHFGYSAFTESRTATVCRSCRSRKPRSKLTAQEIDDALTSVYEEAFYDVIARHRCSARVVLEDHRSEYEQAVESQLIRKALSNDIKLPSWIHDSSLADFIA